MIQTQLYHNCSKQIVMNMGYLLIDIVDGENCVKDDFTFPTDKVTLPHPEKDFFPRELQQALVNLMTEPQLTWINDGAYSDSMFSEEYIRKTETFLST